MILLIIINVGAGRMNLAGFYFIRIKVTFVQTKSVKCSVDEIVAFSIRTYENFPSVGILLITLQKFRTLMRPDRNISRSNASL